MFNSSKARLSAIMALTVSANLLAQPTLVSAEEVDVDTLATNQKSIPLAEQLPVQKVEANTTPQKVAVVATVEEVPTTTAEAEVVDTVVDTTVVDELVHTDVPQPEASANAEVAEVTLAPDAETPLTAVVEQVDPTTSMPAPTEEPTTTVEPTTVIPLAELTGEQPEIETTDAEASGIDASTVLPVMASPAVVDGSQNAVTSVAQDFIMPAYRYADPNSNYWSSITALGGDQIPYVIINPSNGSGTKRIENFSRQLVANSAAGIKSLGYVNTKGFSRSQSDVLAEVDRYVTFYGADQIDGIFFDVTKPGESAAEAAYMADLYNYVKSNHPHMTVMGNPGRTVTNAISPYADIWLTRETTADDYLNGYYEQISDMEKDPASSKRVMHLVHSANPSDYNRIIELSRQRNAGYLMVTDRSFLELPSNFTNLVNQINTGSNSTATTPNPGLSKPATPNENQNGATNVTKPSEPITTNDAAIEHVTPDNKTASHKTPSTTTTVQPSGKLATELAEKVTVRPFPPQASAIAPATNLASAVAQGRVAPVNATPNQSRNEATTPTNSQTTNANSNTSTSAGNTQTSQTTTGAQTSAETKKTTVATSSTQPSQGNASSTSGSTPPATPIAKESDPALLNSIGAVAAIGGIGLVGAGAYVAMKKKAKAE